MRKGAVMAVASAALATLAIGQTVDPEDLGGWRLHSEVTGLVDRVTETDEEALKLIQRFLSYLPSHQNEPPPVVPDWEAPDIDLHRLSEIVPDSRRRGYDVRRVIEAIADKDSVFEIKPQFGKCAVVGLGRLGGRTVGFVANNPMQKAGALDVAGCEKITRFLVLCDSFNIPIVMLVDTPGFVIGIEGERQKAPGKIMNFMSALQQCSVPKLSVIMRKSYGQAYLNMGGGRNSDDVVAWPTAEVSFMDPAYAVQIVTAGRVSNEETIAQIRRSMEKDSDVWGLAEIYAVQDVIPPDETREYLIQMLSIHQMQLSNGVGQHQLANWPTTF